MLVQIENKEQFEKDLKKIIKQQRKLVEAAERLKNITSDDFYTEFLNYVRESEYCYQYQMLLCRYITYENVLSDEEADAYFTYLQEQKMTYPKIDVKDNEKIIFYLPPARSRNYTYRKNLSKEPVKRMIKLLIRNHELKYGKFTQYKKGLIHIENHISKDDYYGVDPDNIDFKRMIDGLVPELLTDDSYRNVTLYISSVLGGTESYTKLIFIPMLEGQKGV